MKLQLDDGMTKAWLWDCDVGFLVAAMYCLVFINDGELITVSFCNVMDLVVKASYAFWSYLCVKASVICDISVHLIYLFLCEIFSYYDFNTAS
jgi:hypothetical protein